MRRHELSVGWMATLALFFFGMSLRAAEWPFLARNLSYVNAKGEARTINAFLWIPPKCERVRGVFLAQQGVVDQQVVESAPVREAAEKADVAIVFLVPGMDINLGAEWTMAALNNVMNQLAQTSGYSEIATAPWLPFGHSTGGVWALRLAAASPERTVAVISFKGQLPLPELARVPVLTVHGEYYEWMKAGDQDFDRRAGIAGLEKGMRGVRTRLDGPHALLIDPGHSHFDCREELTQFLALYLFKAFAFRVANNPASSELRGVDTSGWLTDNSFPQPVRAKAARAKDDQGDDKEASWYFDEELARAAEGFQTTGEKRADQMTSFLDASGQVLPLGVRGLIEPLTPLFEQDGVTFTIRPAFFSSVPPQLLHGGEALGHSETPPQVLKLNGHFESLGLNRFRLQPDFTWPNRGGGYYVQAVHPGDERFRPAVQPGFIPPFEKNTAGQAQRITFPKIPDQVAGVSSVRIAASADSGMPVSLYVLEGPAHVEGDELIISPVPPRTRFPVKVTVVACQWGRSREPKVQTAEFVERSFSITRNP